MKQVVLEVPDSKFVFFMELLKNLGLDGKAKVMNQQSEKEEILQDMSIAVEEVKLAKSGKIQLKSLDQLLAEL